MSTRRTWHIGDQFRIDTPQLATKGVIVKINRRTIVYDAPYMVCSGAPDGWLRGLKIDVDKMRHARRVK